MSKTNNKVPMRRCVGCMESKPKKELVRLCIIDDHVAVDLSGKANGRGIYLCPGNQCLTQAVRKRAIQRGLGVNPNEANMEKLEEELLANENKD